MRVKKNLNIFIIMIILCIEVNADEMAYCTT